MPACKQLVALAAAAACFTAVAKPPQAPDAARQRYEQERAACEKGSAHRDKADCLREAGAAYGEARRGRLDTPAQLEANATARCQALPEPDRDDCRSRVMNGNNSSARGSVESGGIIKETRTRYVQTPEGERRID